VNAPLGSAMARTSAASAAFISARAPSGSADSATYSTASSDAPSSTCASGRVGCRAIRPASIACAISPSTSPSA